MNEIADELQEVDISKWYEDPVYIKQCEKAEEIRVGHEWHNGDFYHNNDNRVCTRCSSCNLEYGRDFEAGNIWLPTQSQLQKLVYDKKGFGRALDLIMALAIPLQGKDRPEWADYWVIEGSTMHQYNWDFMEQVWLAFYMWDTYQKIWDGSDWVKHEAGKKANGRGTD